MAYKTDRLIQLFPDVYSSGRRDTLLYHLLDAIGAELMRTDEALKRLLKSHWIDYAEGSALDGLGAIFGVERRQLADDGALEPDDSFRLRLKSIVPLFTGGGTKKAVEGAVRSALGLPFDLEHLNVPDGLRAGLQNLVRLKEFPADIQIVTAALSEPASPGELTLNLISTSNQVDQFPLFEWTFTRGSGSGLHIERVTPPGLDGNPVGLETRALDGGLVVAQGQTLRIAQGDGRLIASLDGQEVTGFFQKINGGPPLLPEVPCGPSVWRFRADAGGRFDTGKFDDETFDRPFFDVKITWTTSVPLAFDVTIEYFLEAAVQRLVEQYGYSGSIFIFKGLDRNLIQQVVDDTRAAGVRGQVHFSLTLRDDQALSECLHLDGVQHNRDDPAVREALNVRRDARLTDCLDAAEKFMLVGGFDWATFDSNFVLT